MLSFRHGFLRRFSTRLTPNEIVARERTLNYIESPTVLRGSPSLDIRFNPEAYLQNHPDSEHALNIRRQMDEIALLIDKMNGREQVGNKLIVFAATAFLACSLGYTLFQFSDVNTSFTASLPSLFSILEYSTARRLLCLLAASDLLPVDYGSDDPYMIRMVGRTKNHPFTRALRVCVPIGLGAGMDVDSSGPASFLKLGFGFIEVGSVNLKPSISSNENHVQSLGYSLAYDKSRQDASIGLAGVSQRLCDYIESRHDDLLTRNTITCLNIKVTRKDDVETTFADTRLIATADSIAFDITDIPDDKAIISIIDSIDAQSFDAKSVPVIFLKVGLPQSFPPSNAVASAVKASKAVVGVSINGTGVAGGNKTITKFPVEAEMHVSGRIVQERSTDAVGEWYKALDCPNTCKEIVASGGVFCGKDALDKIESGASIINVLTAFVVDGFPVARRIKTQLSVQLMNKGYYNLDEAIGAKHREPSDRLKQAARMRKRF